MTTAFKVELRPHQGVNETPFGRMTVTHAQDMIFLNGRHAGYVGHQDHAPVMLIFDAQVSLPPEAQQRLREEVAALRKKPTGPVNATPSPEQIAELDDQDDEQDEGEE